MRETPVSQTGADQIITSRAQTGGRDAVETESRRGRKIMQVQTVMHNKKKTIFQNNERLRQNFCVIFGLFHQAK